MSNTTVAVLGLRHGERHVHGFLNAGAQKVYAVDLNKELYSKVADSRVITSDDYLSVIPLVDIIVISLPPSLHQQALQAALKTNAKHIWIEKPLLDIGEDPRAFAPDERVEVIHELRRNQTVQDWIAGSEKCEEAWLTWQRPVPPQYNSKRYPVGVVHDLSSHLVDLSFALLGETKLPKIENVALRTSPEANTQQASFTLKFGNVPVHISTAWVDAGDWPEQEITVRMQTSIDNDVSWVGHKSTHRHFTSQRKPTEQQVQKEKDWYTPALKGAPTHFTPLGTAVMTHGICNTIVETLKEVQKP